MTQAQRAECQGPQWEEGLHKDEWAADKWEVAGEGVLKEGEDPKGKIGHRHSRR